MTHERKHYRRFSAAQRFEHLVIMVAFIGLALTGLPQKFAGETWAESVIQALGGIESIRILHRFLAALLMAEVIYHIGVISYKLFVLRQPASMIPRSRDLRDLRDWVLYNLGLKAERPKMPRYNFSNKLDYLVVAFSVLVLVITGFMLWNPIATTTTLPGATIPLARAVHGDQALLAVLVVGIWHTYNVLIKRINLSMFTGKLSRQAMLVEHGEELEQIEQREQPVAPSAEGIARRKRVFWPIAALIAILLVAGLIWFVTFEQTAIDTVPRRDVAVFAPQVQLVKGDASVGAALWPTLRCSFCHGPEATGGPNGAPSLRSDALTFDRFYRQVRTGSDKMPAFRPDEIPDTYLSHLWAWLSTTATF